MHAMRTDAERALMARGDARERGAPSYDLRMQRPLCAFVLVASACGSSTSIATHEIDPRLCPPTFAVASNATCDDRGALCHYADSCGANCECTNSLIWRCGDSGRFSCGDCASDVRCTAGSACASVGGGQCACGSDGVFGCSTGSGSPAALPACPVDEPAMGTACAAAGQECDYFAASCYTACACTAGRFACSMQCGA